MNGLFKIWISILAFKATNLAIKQVRNPAYFNFKKEQFLRKLFVEIRYLLKTTWNYLLAL